MSELYAGKLDKPTKEAQHRSNAAGMGFGFSQLCMFGAPPAAHCACHLQLHLSLIGGLVWYGCCAAIKMDVRAPALMRRAVQPIFCIQAALPKC